MQLESAQPLAPFLNDPTHASPLRGLLTLLGQFDHGRIVVSAGKQQRCFRFTKGAIQGIAHQDGRAESLHFGDRFTTALTECGSIVIRLDAGPGAGRVFGYDVTAGSLNPRRAGELVSSLRHREEIELVIGRPWPAVITDAEPLMLKAPGAGLAANYYES